MESTMELARLSRISCAAHPVADISAVGDIDLNHTAGNPKAVRLLAQFPPRGDIAEGRRIQQTFQLSA